MDNLETETQETSQLNTILMICSRFVAKRAFHSGIRLSNYENLKLTFFSKPQCGLCEEAKDVIDDTFADSEFARYDLSSRMETVNINKDPIWWKKYCFDIPVLHIEDKNDPSTLKVIMHHFREDELADTIRKFKK